MIYTTTWILHNIYIDKNHMFFWVLFCANPRLAQLLGSRSRKVLWPTALRPAKASAWPGLLRSAGRPGVAFRARQAGEGLCPELVPILKDQGFSMDLQMFYLICISSLLYLSVSWLKYVEVVNQYDVLLVCLICAVFLFKLSHFQDYLDFHRSARATLLEQAISGKGGPQPRVLIYRCSAMGFCAPVI